MLEPRILGVVTLREMLLAMSDFSHVVDDEEGCCMARLNIFAM